MSEILTQEQAQGLCEEWQQRLRLQDWKVKVLVLPQYDMPEQAGLCSCYAASKEAVIKICSEIGAGGSIVNASFPCDMEEVLVHELIELHFDAFKLSYEDDAPKHTAQELAINMLAGALIAAKRGWSVTLDGPEI